jgi:hypothetical protein
MRRFIVAIIMLSCGCMKDNNIDEVRREQEYMNSLIASFRNRSYVLTETSESSCLKGMRMDFLCKDTSRISWGESDPDSNYLCITNTDKSTCSVNKVVLRGLWRFYMRSADNMDEIETKGYNIRTSLIITNFYILNPEPGSSPQGAIYFNFNIDDRNNTLLLTHTNAAGKKRQYMFSRVY